MNENSLKWLRMVLLGVCFLLILITFVRYFYTGTFNYGTTSTALGCLVVYLITNKKKQVN